MPVLRISHFAFALNNLITLGLLCISSLFSAIVYANTYQVSIIDLYPWGYIEEGVPKGIHIDILKNLNEITADTFEPSIKPYARVERDLRHGKTPFSFLVNNSSDRKAYAYEGVTLFELGFGVLHHESKNIDSLAALADLNIGIMRGLSISKCFSSNIRERSVISGCDKNWPAFVHVPVKEYAYGIKLLSDDKLDGILGSIPTLKRILAQPEYRHGLSKISIKSPIFQFAQVPLKVLYSKPLLSQQQINELNKAFAQIIANEQHVRIYDRHMKISR